MTPWNPFATFTRCWTVVPMHDQSAWLALLIDSDGCEINGNDFIITPQTIDSEGGVRIAFSRGGGG